MESRPPRAPDRSRGHGAGERGFFAVDFFRIAPPDGGFLALSAALKALSIHGRAASGVVRLEIERVTADDGEHPIVLV